MYNYACMCVHITYIYIHHLGVSTLTLFAAQPEKMRFEDASAGPQRLGHLVAPGEGAGSTVAETKKESTGQTLDGYGFLTERGVYIYI